MPWQHCGADVSDDQPCPSCGQTKEQWTVEWNVTRSLRVTRRVALRLALEDAAGEPVAGAQVRVVDPDGGEHEATTDEAGQASVPLPGEGDARVSFVDRTVVRVQDEGEGEEQGAEEAEAGGDEGADADEGGEDDAAWIEAALGAEEHAFAKFWAGDVPGFEDRVEPAVEETEPSDAEPAGGEPAEAGPPGFVCRTGRRHRFRLLPAGVPYVIGPGGAGGRAEGDRFVLAAHDGSYEAVTTWGQAEALPGGARRLWFDPPPPGDLALELRLEPGGGAEKGHVIAGKLVYPAPAGGEPAGQEATP